jgi:hypothetical protein
MATDTLLTIDMITREILMSLKNQLVFGKSVNRDYDDQFAKRGAKIGATINVRKPARFIVTEGPALQLQDYTEQYVPVVITNQDHVDCAWTTADLTLSMDDFRKRFIDPATIALANKIDFNGSVLYQDVQSSVGALGTTPNTLLTYLQARSKLANNGAPLDPLTMVVSPLADVTLVDALKTLFQSSEKIKEQYEKGWMGMAGGMTFKMSQNIRQHTVGTWDTGSTGVIAAGADQTGSSLSTSGWANSTRILNKGDVITIGNTSTLVGPQQVNPQNRSSTGNLQQFTVTSNVDSDGAGLATIPIYPAITISGQYQTVNSAAVAGMTINPFAAEGVVGAQNLLFHRDAFCLAMADLEDVSGLGAECYRVSDKDSGMSLRVVQQYDINNDRKIVRIDSLYGWKTIYPELACRVAGGAL